MLSTIAQMSKLGILVREGSWRQARDLLGPLGDAVGYIPPPPPPPRESKPEVKAEQVELKVEPAVVEAPKRTQLERQVYTHFLCLGSMVHNHVGEGAKATGMVKSLHAVLDEGTEGDAGLGGGVWEVSRRRRLSSEQNLADRCLWSLSRSDPDRVPVSPVFAVQDAGAVALRSVHSSASGVHPRVPRYVLVQKVSPHPRSRNVCRCMMCDDGLCHLRCLGIRPASDQRRPSSSKKA